MSNMSKERCSAVTELVFILDRSGSMTGLEKDTIGGFNSMIEKQKREEGEALVSVVLFDHETEVIYDRVPIAQVKPMTTEQYYTRGLTALMDAMGGAIHHIKTIHKYAREEDRPEKTIFIITTDGYENASRKYSSEKVKKMVEHEKEKYGWEFLFLGANIDAVKTAGDIGIESNRAVDFVCDEEGTRLNYDVISDTVARVRACKAMPAAAAFSRDEMANGDWAAPIKKDFRRRKKDRR